MSSCDPPGGCDLRDIDVVSVHSSGSSVAEQCDIAELFSPPRLCSRAARFGLRPGFSHDLSTGFDLLTTASRAQSWHELQACQPKVLLACPPCTWYSRLHFFNVAHLTALERDAQQRDADLLLTYAVRCCHEQTRHGRGFVFEHPILASSWHSPSVQSLLMVNGVHTVSFDQCATGLVAPNGLPIQKRTKLMSNIPEIIEHFSHLQCACLTPHQSLQGYCLGVQLSKYCQVYTPELCDAFLECISAYLRL